MLAGCVHQHDNDGDDKDDLDDNEWPHVHVKFTGCHCLQRSQRHEYNNDVNYDDDPGGEGDDDFDGDDDDRLWPDASLDMILMVMMMNINNHLYVLRSHKCHNDPASTQEDESKQDGVWGMDCPHVGRMVSKSFSKDDNV